MDINKQSTYAELLIRLSPRQRAFVEAYVPCGEGAESARRAGYQTANANTRAYKLLQNQKVAAAVDAGRKIIASKAVYGINEAKAELDDIIAQAKELGDVEAVIYALDLKARLFGLIKGGVGGQ